MALSLTYGNRPPARAFIRLGQKIRSTELRQLVNMQHEFWAISLENFGGMIFPALPSQLSTTSTTYNFGIGLYDLSSFTPFIEILNPTSDGTKTFIFWRAFCYNAQFQVEILDSDYNVLDTSSSSVIDGTWQWVGSKAEITIPANKIVGLRFKFRRLTFDTVASVKQIASRCHPNNSSDIPL